MALLNDQLSVWEIAFRWAGYEPKKFQLRIPLLVRDNFRILIHEIHYGHLDCLTLNMQKYFGDDSLEAKLYIRHWMDSVDSCTEGSHYDKEFLKWAIIDRQSMQEWCERHKVPLPEFWFPTGWGVDYKWPDDEPDDEIENQSGESAETKELRIDKRHRIKMACQQIGLTLWAKDQNLTIKEVATSKEVQQLGGGSEYELETVQGWISDVDTRSPNKKRGRKRKNNSGSDNADATQPTVN